MSYWIPVLVLLVFLYFWYAPSEAMAGDMWPVASGEPVPYTGRKKCPSGAICLRRWRDPIPVGPGARQVTDDVWDRTYASGIGFQLY
jgi:hypothetical protein